MCVCEINRWKNKYTVWFYCHCFEVKMIFFLKWCGFSRLIKLVNFKQLKIQMYFIHVFFHLGDHTFRFEKSMVTIFYRIFLFLFFQIHEQQLNFHRFLVWIIGKITTNETIIITLIILLIINNTYTYDQDFYIHTLKSKNTTLLWVFLNLYWINIVFLS